jgi:hypothetical protein
MSTKTTTAGNSIGATTTHPAIETGRFERAVTSSMDVSRVADRLYAVTNGDDKTYTVDLATGVCDCPDAQYRGDQFVCKHAIRASVVETFAHTVSTELVARVVRHAREHSCPVDGHGGNCPGPLGGTDQLPCPTCCDATRSDGVDEYDVWRRVVAPYVVSEDRR